jgi:hypothetical protein
MLIITVSPAPVLACHGQASGSHTPNRRPRRHTRAAGGNLAPSYHSARQTLDDWKAVCI